MIKENFNTYPGRPFPLGANVFSNGVQFSIFSRHATRVTLVFFENERDDIGIIHIDLDSKKNKTGDIWHIFVEGVKERQLYGYKIDGPYTPLEGHRYNYNMLLLDPYAKAITGEAKWNFLKARGYDSLVYTNEEKINTQSSTPFVPKSIVVKNPSIRKVQKINHAFEDIIIYELHVKGFTKHESSNISYKGTYKGLIEKIPYIKELGITAVELMPIQEFDELENINVNPETGERLKNYWGYSTFAFFAVKGNYAASDSLGGQVDEFRELIDAFHEADIEVYLDVVFNHTGEGDEHGPTTSFKGIDNSIYYILEDNKAYYKNYSGCGNTVNCNHPLVRDFILDCLRYWVVEMGVDGFRFDLASILGRDQKGDIISNPPLIERIEEDPILRDTKIIAEAWDAAGAYQVGEFLGRWAEWNGKYRDDVRKFWRGENGTIGAFATRLSGSADLYYNTDRGPFQSVNFITCHDGFTMYDLVSYNNKHNIANGEENRDGDNHNLSMNFGIEGDEDSTPYIRMMRKRQVKNFIATLFVSQGIPMLLAGDEFLRTQGGNNNSYCQDSEVSWLNWALKDENEDVFQFTKDMIYFRKKHRSLSRKYHFTGNGTAGNSDPDIQWFNFDGNSHNWQGSDSTLVCLIDGSYNDDSDICILFNASMVHYYATLPLSPSGKPWNLVVDTSHAECSFLSEGNEKQVDGEKFYIQKKSLAIFIT